ncbi:MAG TPA: DEAD/DEAH box helicase [Streptosporangiaceae bacterium]|nr:DEAD/DEAH box helicase [Streptosporangiaceae bacterium]
MSANEQVFPLFNRADQAGLLDGGSGLVVAPTATGKSHIGREAICRTLANGTGTGLHAYLVPFRALAAEIHDSFVAALNGTSARIRLLTGDHRDPLRPDQADLVVATYESFAGLMRNQPIKAGLVVADEVHLIADPERGPVVEGLLAQLRERTQGLLALSAVVDNGEELAGWLNIPLLRGTAEDRTVGLILRHAFADDLDGVLLETLRRFEDQALVFCSSRAGAERVAKLIADTLEYEAPHLPEPPEDQDDPVLGLLPKAVAYHHAGLAKPVRQHIETLFRHKKLRVITCTPTLAAGVNLPAGVTIVRDVFRREQIRGQYRPVLLPAGEIVNMLGRAGRPGQVSKGTGIVLIERDRKNDVGDLVDLIREGRGGHVCSHLTDSFETLMRFVLAVVVERGETTRDDVGRAFERTLAHHEQRAEVAFDRTLRDDLMEDLPAYDKARQDGVTLVGYALTTEGVNAIVDSRGKRYKVQLTLTEFSCSCPARSRYFRGQVCKHQALVVHELLFGTATEPEARARTLYLCGHEFGPVLDIGTRLSEALGLLLTWGLAEKVPGGWRATELGQVASASGFDLLLVHQVADRLHGAAVGDYRMIARWAVEDFHADPRDREKWLTAVTGWLDEAERTTINLPVRYRGDWEQGLDRLAQVCGLYERAARSLGRDDLTAAARDAAGALRYGVAPALVPLMALGFPQLRRARARRLYDRGVRDVADLAWADPAQLVDSRLPRAYLDDWVQKATEIFEATKTQPDRDENPEGFDDLVARFRLDPAAL